MEIVYSDINQDIVGIDSYIYNLDDISQSIDNILVTERTERFFLPEFGSSLRSVLFELAVAGNTFYIYELIRDSILRWEQRVKLIESESSVRFEKETNTLYLRFTFEVPELNIKNYTYSRRIDINRFR